MTVAIRFSIGAPSFIERCSIVQGSGLNAKWNRRVLQGPIASRRIKPMSGFTDMGAGSFLEPRGWLVDKIVGCSDIERVLGALLPKSAQWGMAGRRTEPRDTPRPVQGLAKSRIPGCSAEAIRTGPRAA